MGSPDPIEGALRAAAEAEDRRALWEALTPLGDRIEDDARVAAFWADALRATPARPELTREAGRILEAWPHDPGIVGRACSALLATAERPIDEPPLEAGPASVAAGAADRCFAAQPEDKKRDPDVGGRLLALRAHGLRLLGPRRADDAVKALEAAIALAPDRAQWRFELGLVHKHRRDFEAMLAASAGAAELEPTKGALWNVAIAATALGRGEDAADAWRRLGVEVTARPGALPLTMGLEPAQVRLSTVGSELSPAALPARAASFEVVWAQPLSPCHGVIRSPTQRDAVADFGDVVLWDGAPVTVREREGRPVPCFPVLGVLKRGDERRFRFLAMQQASGQVDALSDALPEGTLLYAHGERVETLCPRCAAGESMVRHEHLAAEEHRMVFGKLLAPGDASLEGLARALDDAKRAHPGVLLAVPGLYEALGDTPAAGKHHQRWGAIERALQAGAPR